MSSTSDRTPLEDFVKNGFPMDLAKQALSCPFAELLKGQDISSYFAMRPAERLPTVVIPSRFQPSSSFGKRTDLEDKIGKIAIETEQSGVLTLDEFLTKSELFSQGYLVVYKGDIVYEKYPRMKPTDNHMWMSCGKPTAGLIIELLIEEGKIDDQRVITDYITDWKGTDWDTVVIKDVMDMAAGMDMEEIASSREDPNSTANRIYQTEFDCPNQVTGVKELIGDVLKVCKKAHPAGEKFEYASGYTETLVLLAEAASGKRWGQLFDDMVWSKVKADGPIQFHTTKDGVCCSHGLVSSTLRDMARFAMLFTPSGSKVSSETVVTKKILDRIHDSVRSHEFLMKGSDGPVFASFLGGDKDPFLGNSRQ